MPDAPITPISKARHNVASGCIIVPFEDWKLIRSVVEAATAHVDTVRAAEGREYRPPGVTADAMFDAVTMFQEAY